MSRRVHVAVLAAALAGCELTYQPDVGDLTGAGPGGPDGGGVGGGDASVRCGDSDPATPVSFAADVQPLLLRPMGGCGGCHTTSVTSGFNLASYDGLRRGGLNSGSDVIVAGDPCASVLVQKLGPAPPFGARMPYNGPPYFSAEEQQRVRDWIAEGARNN